MATFLNAFSSFVQCLDAKRRHQSQSLRRRKKYLPSIEWLEGRTLLTTFIVNSLNDDNVGSGDTGDLRYIINRANELGTGTAVEPDVIQFSGVTLTDADHTIYVGRGAAGTIPLPDITDAMIIDATTAGGFDNVGGLMLTIDGGRLRGQANGLTLLGGDSTIRALEIVNFPGNGILVKSSNNTIGGDEIGYLNGEPNNPAGRLTILGEIGTTTPVVVRPPQGNVISANGGDGVLIIDGANNNLLQGNFIGTDIAGTTARGNHGDGVAIINSDDNKLYGTTPPDNDNPFVFYNVISGNRGNGLVIDSSNNTIVYANFFGLGADNNTPVGNRLNGVLIEGTSDNTRFGFNIPLGNVTSANGRNGVEVKDTASRTLLMNTFSGMAAFNPSAQVANHRSGVLITSTGGDQVFGTSTFSTVILTCQFSGNDRHGIEIKGNAAGIQVSQSVIGMETNGLSAQPNQRNGIDISGKASGIEIGGFEPSVLGGSEFPDGELPIIEAGNLISGNRRNGVAVRGKAQDIKIVNSFIGTDITTESAAANGKNGIFITAKSGIQIGLALGATDPTDNFTHLDRNIIAFNDGDGVLVKRGSGNSILGSSIYSNVGLGINVKGNRKHQQAAPVISSASVDNVGSTSVTGTFTGEANTSYQIELFANVSADAGDGQIFLGFATVTTDSMGLAEFVISGLVNPEPLTAEFISTTATSPTGTTSKFSDAIEATQIV